MADQHSTNKMDNQINQSDKYTTNKAVTTLKKKRNFKKYLNQDREPAKELFRIKTYLLHYSLGISRPVPHPFHCSHFITYLQVQEIELNNNVSIEKLTLEAKFTI